MSGAGSFYARTVLTSPIHDLTTGFKGFRRETLEQLDLPSMRSDGFGFQIEVTATLLALARPHINDSPATAIRILRVFSMFFKNLLLVPGSPTSLQSLPLHISDANRSDFLVQVFFWGISHFIYGIRTGTPTNCLPGKSFCYKH